MELARAVDLAKRYPGAAGWALRGVNLGLQSGDVYGLVGENGAGKTTLLRILLGLLRPSAGRVTISRGVRVAYVPERPAVWTTLSVREHLRAAGRCSGLGGRSLAAAVDRALHLADLGAKAEARVGTLSRGMLQRLAIAQAAMRAPDLVVMDEPASGLDPGGQKGVRDLVQALHHDGATILLSSHYLVDLEMVCTRVGVLHCGQLVFEDSLEGLGRRYRRQVAMELDGEADPVKGDLVQMGVSFRAAGRRLVFDDLGDPQYFAVMSALVGKGLRVLSLGHPGSLLERLFLEAVGREGP